MARLLDIVYTILYTLGDIMYYTLDFRRHYASFALHFTGVLGILYSISL